MRMIIYNWFGRARQWTPRQVDELELDELEYLPLMEEACLEASDIIQKEVEAQNKHSR